MNNALVINTSPTLALTAALGSLELLAQIYGHIIFSDKVAEEIRDAGSHGFGVAAFEHAVQQGSSFEIMALDKPIVPWLMATLDAGEASVIALAQQTNISLVCIDELAGRRIARLNGLNVTGSLGILLKLKTKQLIPAIEPCMRRMRSQGIWLSADLERQALQLANE